MLMITMVVIGIYSFRPGLSMIMSPGNLPKGSLTSQGHSRLTMMRRVPKPNSIFCIPKTKLFQILEVVFGLTTNRDNMVADSGNMDIFDTDNNNGMANKKGRRMGSSHDTHIPARYEFHGFRF